MMRNEKTQSSPNRHRIVTVPSLIILFYGVIDLSYIIFITNMKPILKNAIVTDSSPIRHFLCKY